jgi:hypothetical protein
MAGLSIRVEVAIALGEHDAEETDLLTRQLRDELLELDVDTLVIPASVPPPTGAKGADASLLGTLMLTASSDPGVLTAIIEAIRAWTNISRHRTARLEIDGDVLDMGGLTASNQTRLIDLYISRHTQAD